MFAVGFTDPVIEIGVILSGFTLFMLGVNFLGDGLTEVAGTKINYYIEKYTSTLFMSMVVGAIITAIMHSSTAATVISISLVRAGMMSLKQAIGISIGANLGTTMTSLVIGLNVEEYGHYLVFIGGIMMLFLSRKSIKNWGKVIFGFGILFVGLQMMSDKLLLIQEYPQFTSFMTSLQGHRWLALGGSTLATVVINSSTAVVGITQKLFASGEMDMIVASAFVFGSNVGTTLTAVLVSHGGSVSTKRAGWFHVIYNIIGGLLGMLIIVPYSNFITYLNSMINGAPEMAVALNHFVFNLGSMILVIPFLNSMIKLLEILFPGEDKSFALLKQEPMDEGLIDVLPDAAFNLVKERSVMMMDVVVESLKTSKNYLSSKDEEDYDVIMQMEEIVNRMDTEITSYLLKMAKTGFRLESYAVTYTKSLDIIKNIERMSDLTVNLGNFYKHIFEDKEEFVEESMLDLNTMYDLLINIVLRSKDILKTQNLNDYDKLLSDEAYLDLIEAKYRERHFRRLTDGLDDTLIASSLYVDILGTLERIGDHSVNVSRNVFSVMKVHD